MDIDNRLRVAGDTPLSLHEELEASSVRAAIPQGLSEPEIGVYQTLINVSRERKSKGEGPRPVVVITDIGKDCDDLAALVVLKEFHRLKLVKLVAVVANLMPAEKRARLATGALDSLGLKDVPVACGTRGSPNDHTEQDYEFIGDFMTPTDMSLQNGQDLLLDIYRTAKDKGTKLVLVCLSSLQDIQQFASTHPDLVAECTGEVHMQGGNYFSDDGNFEPDNQAANNIFNFEAATAWHSFIQENGLSSHTYTKAASYAAPVSSDLFVELQDTGHPIGAYLCRVHVEQSVAFYNQACETDPEKRFTPFRDQNWFLAQKTNWHQRSHAEGDMLPVGREVIPYLTKIILYDVHAAMGVAGRDVTYALNILQIRDRVAEISNAKIPVHHWIVRDDPSTVDPEPISVAVSALMKGSLLAVQQGILSEPS